MVDWLGWGGLALGTVSYLQNRKDAKSAAETANRLVTTQEGVSREALDLARQQYGDVRATNMLLRQLAERVLGEASLFDTPEMREGFARLTGMHLATLSGRDPATYSIYNPQFQTIDKATEIERRSIREGLNTERQRIADTIPRGPARVSLLAELNRKGIDAENAVVAKATRRKEDLAIKLRQQALGDADAFFKATPQERAKLITQAGRIISGAPQPSTGELLQAGGMTNNALNLAVSQLESAKKGNQALAQLAGMYLTHRTADKPKPVSEPYTPPTKADPGRNLKYLFDEDDDVTLFDHP